MRTPTLARPRPRVPLKRNPASAAARLAPAAALLGAGYMIRSWTDLGFGALILFSVYFLLRIK